MPSSDETMQLSSEQAGQAQQRLIDSFGGRETEAEDGQLFVLAAGATAPSAPGRVPTGKVPNSRSPIGLTGPLVRLACSLYNPNPGGFVDRYLDFGEYTNSRGVADGLMRFLCEDPPAQPPSEILPPPVQAPPPVLPYSGGQCPGVDYTIDYRITRPAFPDGTVVEDRTSGSTWIGPIGSVVALGNISGTAYAWDLTHDTENSTGPRRNRLGSISSPLGRPSLSITAIRRQDGLPDDCGDPSPVVPENPGTPTPDPLPPISYDPGDGGEPIETEPTIRITPGPNGPQLTIDTEGDPNGDVNIQYNYDFGGVTINFPDSPAVCCPPTAIGPKPEDISPQPRAPIPTLPPGVPPQDEPDDETDTVIRAVIVNATGVDTPSTEIAALGGGPSVFAPRLGTLQFKIASGDGLIGWTGDIDIKNVRQYIEVPAVQGAINVKVFPFGNTNLTVIRLYQTIDSPIAIGAT